MLCFEGETLLFGSFQLTLAIFQLLIQKHDRLRHFAAVTSNILVAEQVDHLLHHLLRQLGIFRIAQIRLADCGGNFEHVILFGSHGYIVAQRLNRTLHFQIGRNLVTQRSGPDNLFQIDCTGERLTHAGNRLLAIAGYFQLL